MPDAIADQLNHLSALSLRQDTLEAEKHDAYARLLSPELLAQLDAITAEYADAAQALAFDIECCKTAIKQAVLAQGVNVAGTHLQAIVVAGRITYDHKALDVYALSHPEIKAYRKAGEPSVQIRARGLSR
jgi:hypothetical protein